MLEGVAPGAFVAHVSVTDADSNGHVTCDVTSDHAHSSFKLVPHHYNEYLASYS